MNCALRLAPLAFARPGDLCPAASKDFDLEAAEWRFAVGTTHMSTSSRSPPNRSRAAR